MSAPIPPRAIAAARRLVGPARVLGGLLQLLWVTAAVAAASIGVALFVLAWRAGASGIGVGAVAAPVLLLFVPAWWLRHARGTFGDLLELPQRLETLGQIPKLTIDSKEDVAALRSVGFFKAARMIRTTVGEVTDYFSPASTVVELASPPFWLWTTVAVIATGFLAIFALAAVGLLLLV